MIGSSAFRFKLRDSRGNIIDLNKKLERKNIILVFYPKDFTPGCIKQLSELRDNYSRIERAQAVVFGINGDSAESHRKFIEDFNFPFELLVDKNLTVSAKFDCLKPNSTGVRRTVIGIARDGTIVFYERGMPTISEILKPIRKANRLNLKKAKLRS